MLGCAECWMSVQFRFYENRRPSMPANHKAPDRTNILPRQTTLPIPNWTKPKPRFLHKTELKLKKLFRTPLTNATFWLIYILFPKQNPVERNKPTETQFTVYCIILTPLWGGHTMKQELVEELCNSLPDCRPPSGFFVLAKSNSKLWAK